MSYTITVTVPLAWNEAVQRTREALAGQGFGILSEIDVRATFAAKLGAGAAEELCDYVILGACNPALASRALSAEPDTGALLPCNVVVRRGKKTSWRWPGADYRRWRSNAILAGNAPGSGWSGGRKRGASSDDPTGAGRSRAAGMVRGFTRGGAKLSSGEGRIPHRPGSRLGYPPPGCPASLRALAEDTETFLVLLCAQFTTRVPLGEDHASTPRDLGGPDVRVSGFLTVVLAAVLSGGADPADDDPDEGDGHQQADGPPPAHADSATHHDSYVLSRLSRASLAYRLLRNISSAGAPLQSPFD